METHAIYFWNLENLFDIENAGARRSDFLKEKLKKELKGWTSTVLNKKIDNLVSIISRFQNGLGPDLFGVCEVENDHVLERLTNKMSTEIGRTYKFVIIEGEDKRGIDTALIYDEDKYSTEPETFTLRIIKRNSTRDLFQVHVETQSGNKLICVLNHWPSRSGGELESEPYRIMVAENLAYWIERIHEEQGQDASIVLMGDFNDNPYNRSMWDYLMARNNRTQVKKKPKPDGNYYMYNLMFRFLDLQYGTYVYGSELNLLDQFIVSRSILSESTDFKFNLDSVDIIRYPELFYGQYNTPLKYGRPSNVKSGNNPTKKTYNPDGFSDHLPIELILEESS